MRPHIKCPPYQMTAHFLCKPVKIASLMGMSNASITTLFLYKHGKTAPPLQMSTISVTTHSSCKIPKNAFTKHNTTLLVWCPPIQHNTTRINSLHIPMQTCQNCVHAQLSTNSTLHFPYQNKSKLRPSHNTSHLLYKQMSTISITIHLLYKQAKIAPTKCPLYQSLHIYYTNKPKLRPPNVHCINRYTFTMQTSQNCANQTNHYTFATQKRSFSRF